MAHSKECKKVQEGVLICIIWNAFCEAFSNGWGLQLGHVIKLMVILPMIHLGSLRIGFKFFERCGFGRGEVIAAMFCASHKTLAFGLPLLNTIFEGNPNLAAYCAPLMFIHPLQLVLGSLFLGRLERYSSAETKVGLQ
jgi:sodium/bile acid cotransporter 7